MAESPFLLQERDWLQTHKNTRDLLYHPVLPIVFYSGPRGWGQLRPLWELVYHGDLFGPLIPQLGIAKKLGFFVIREHAGLNYRVSSKLRQRGRRESGSFSTKLSSSSKRMAAPFASAAVS